LLCFEREKFSSGRPLRVEERGFDVKRVYPDA
jgi:hypothetical protein